MDDDEQCEPYCPRIFVNIFSLKSSTSKRAERSPYVGRGVFIEGGIRWFAYTTPDY